MRFAFETQQIHPLYHEKLAKSILFALFTNTSVWNAEATHVIIIAPFRSQIFKIFFASGGKGALAPLTKILQTPLA